jgi:ADP-ribose pyrophosphatase
MEKIKIISKERKYSDWLKLDVVKALLPNNQEVEREIIIKGDAVAIVALTDDNQLFIVKQPRVAQLIPDFIELPAGMVEEKHGFDHFVAAKAELKEETGCDPEECKWTYLGKFVPDPGTCTTRVHIYLAQHAKKRYELDLDPDEFLEASTMPLSEAIAKVKDFNDRTFNDACAIIGLTRAANYLGL